MRAYCFECKKWVESFLVEKTEQDEINGVQFSCIQKHAYCNECQNEVFPDEIVDENVCVAHDAYRETQGIITVKEMQQILSIYKIGAKPLSQLLGWGENSIERQMKHTIPDKEHSDRLKELVNPFRMLETLVLNEERISFVAFRKAIDAAIDLIQKLISSEEMQNEEVINFQAEEKQYAWDSNISVRMTTTRQENKISSVAFSSQPSAFKSSPFEFPVVA